MRRKEDKRMNFITNDGEDNELKILVTEDNPVNSQILVEMIKACGGYKIITAINGHEAVECCKQDMPDIIFMDIQMPIMNGIEAYEEISNYIRISNKIVHVVAVTAYATKEDKKMCLEVGMNEYISKPISFDDIRGVLRKLEKTSV